MMKLRAVIGARNGFGAWVGQLFTAVIMIVVLAWLGVAFLVMNPSDHGELVVFISKDLIRVPATLGILALIWHAWLGAKSVLMDYVPWIWIRICKYIGAFVYLLLCMIWLLGIFWGVV